MMRRPPRSTRTDTLFPYTTLFRSASGPNRGSACRRPAPHCPRRGGEPFPCSLALALLVGGVAGEVAGRGEFAQLVTHHVLVHRDRHMRSDERRVGKEWVSTCRSRLSPFH